MLFTQTHGGQLKERTGNKSVLFSCVFLVADVHPLISTTFTWETEPCEPVGRTWHDIYLGPCVSHLRRSTWLNCCAALFVCLIRARFFDSCVQSKSQHAVLLLCLVAFCKHFFIRGQRQCEREVKKNGAERRKTQVGGCLHLPSSSCQLGAAPLTSSNQRVVYLLV